MTTNPPEDTPEPGTYPPPDSPTTPPPAPGYQAPGQGQTPPPGYGQVPPGYGQTPPPGYGPTPPPYGQPGYAAPLSPSDERLWATLAHAGGIVLGFIAPLVVWLVFRERSRYVDDQAKEALNFQILVAIAYVVGGITSAIVIGIFIALAAWILTIVFGIQGAIAANKGDLYRYPLNWRLIK